MKPSTKSFAISKKAVYAAWKRVKANRGAAGIDQQSLAGFEEDLGRNLYKVWNRMASGSYFPPPVKAVGIPKKSGGIRILGVPTVGDPRLAEDLLQDVFLKALAEGGGFCELTNPRAWLFRVTRNRLIDHLRTHKLLGELPPVLPAKEEEPTPLESLTACLPRALSEMPEEDREALTLCDLEGLPQAEFARLKGLSLPSAKSRVQRARRRLGEHLKDACQVKFDEAGQVCCFVPRTEKGGKT